MQWKIGAGALLLAALTGCATSYQAKGMTGGFEDVQLSENTFQVTFSGNGVTSASDVANMALLRSAELALEHGYPFFVLTDGSTSVEQFNYVTPTNTTTSGTVTAYGNTAYLNANSHTTGGQVIPIRKPSRSNTIVCLKEKPTNVAAYEAQLIYNSLAPKYKK